MSKKGNAHDQVAPWMKLALGCVFLVGFTILIWMSVRSYHDAPPIPDKVVTNDGTTLFSKADILGGQQVFLKNALMENGTVWGHGGYLGPDFSAEYLHTLHDDAANILADEKYGTPFKEISKQDQDAIDTTITEMLKENRYEKSSGTLLYTDIEAASFTNQLDKWEAYFLNADNSSGLPPEYITDKEELRKLTAFFAWAAWASVVNRPGHNFSYTNNFPYDPQVGNNPPADAYLWSAISLIALLGGIALVLFAFGKFNFLGWEGSRENTPPLMIAGESTASQRAVIKYFVIVCALFLAQVLIGGALAHYRAEPGNFYGIDLPSLLPSNIMRTWHLQLAIFWIATAYVAGGLVMASAIGKKEPKGQVAGINILFGALVVVVVGSLFGELAGIKGLLGKFWFMFGHQGWEYLDLGRIWQVLLAVGLVFWLILLIRAIGDARKNPAQKEIVTLFIIASFAIPLFYLPALFFGSTTHFTVVDMWRFWIIHLWVEGFFELFTTVMVAIIFLQLGLVTRMTATRVIYLDAILYLAGGIVGTAHHWYWTGQSNVTMAFAAVFSALEVVPLTLLTLDAWDFVKVTRGERPDTKEKVSVKHKWAFMFLIAVGFWNFLGAGVFGFLINTPIISYFEVGTQLTPNHGHAAMMGVFGMLAMGLAVFSMRHVLNDQQWGKVEKYVRISFWGLNIGLGLMIIMNLFPGGVLQLSDVLKNGYWHARSAEFTRSGIMSTIEWLRLPADAVFIGLGVFPALIASLITYGFVIKQKKQ